jgi:Cu-Zn family superoxide dismutase
MHAARTARWLTAAALMIGVTAFLPPAVASPSPSDGSADRATARAVVRDVNNVTLGVVLIQTTRVAIAGRLSGLAPGFHGFHIHGVGVCEPAFIDPAGTPVPFGSAGGHLNPAGVGHGHHAGDLPLLLVTGDGTALAAAETDAVTLAAIFDAVRRDLIVVGYEFF